MFGKQQSECRRDGNGSPIGKRSPVELGLVLLVAVVLVGLARLACNDRAGIVEGVNAAQTTATAAETSATVAQTTANQNTGSIIVIQENLTEMNRSLGRIEGYVKPKPAGGAP